MSINLLIPEFEVPPSKLAQNMNTLMHDTLRPSRSNALTKTAGRNPLTIPNPNPSPAVDACDRAVPGNVLLLRLAIEGRLRLSGIDSRITPASWPYDVLPMDPQAPAPDQPYIAHRIPPQRSGGSVLNPTSPAADLVNRTVDLFV